jgi:hypothetical protein
VPGQETLTDALAGTPTEPLPFPPAGDPPTWSASTNPDLDRTIGLPPPVRSGVGLLTTPNNSYLQARISGQYGPLFVVRAKAPTSPDTRAGQWVGSRRQLRYWSVCEFSTLTNESLGCLSDHEVRLSKSGWFTVVVSDPRNRPANAANWLPFGPYEGWFTYRQALPAPTYRQAIQAVAMRTDFAAAMGPYYPVAGYCTAQAFTRQGARCLSG